MNLKDQSTDRKRKLSFILYDSFSSPKYFEIKKSFFKFLIIVLPTLTLASISIVILGLVYFKNIVAITEQKEPALISELKIEKEKLAQNLAEYLKDYKLFQGKLTSTKQPNINTLSFFKKTLGQVDLTQEPTLAIDQIRITSDNNQLHFQFNIVNLTKDKSKLRGIIFVIMKDGNNKFSIYPQNSIEDNEMQINFNLGENFTTSRFRPVDAPFELPSAKSNLLFKVIIFSRTGDLIHKQLISENYNQ
jgi:hypothetical protein